MPDDNNPVWSSFRSFGKTRADRADQLRVEPLLRWRRNWPAVRVAAGAPHSAGVPALEIAAWSTIQTTVNAIQRIQLPPLGAQVISSSSPKKASVVRTGLQVRITASGSCPPSRRCYIRGALIRHRTRGPSGMPLVQ